VAGYSERGSVKGGEFPNQLDNYRLFNGFSYHVWTWIPIADKRDDDDDPKAMQRALWTLKD
jgi:hypothetical protein